MRIWVVACATFALLLGYLLWIEYRLAHPTVPPGVQRSECLSPAPEGQRWRDSLRRQGGRLTRYPNARWQGHAYTIPDIAQGRDLRKYERLELSDFGPTHPWEKRGAVFVQARRFVAEHWRIHKRGYLIFTRSSVDHTGTSHLFIEPNDSGRWRVYWRQLRRELIDEPTAYWVLWVVSGTDQTRTPVPATQVPDPNIDELEFRDVCGELVDIL